MWRGKAVEWINSKDLFCNDDKAMVLCEYTREIFLIRKFIEIADKGVRSRVTRELASFEGICYLFAKSIVDYAKMAYDNMLLGHFYSTHMIIRTMIENNVCFEIILNNKSEGLWKYYFVQSYRNTVMKAERGISEGNKEILEKMYHDFNISKDFIEKRGEKKAYIDMNYGWTYKINKIFTFSSLCDLVNRKEYDDFSMMSEYSHGTSIYQKIGGSIFGEHIMTMISSIYVGICRLVMMYCLEYVEEEFDEVAEELEGVFCDFLDIERSIH